MGRSGIAHLGLSQARAEIEAHGVLVRYSSEPQRDAFAHQVTARKRQIEQIARSEKGAQAKKQIREGEGDAQRDRRVESLDV